MNSNGQDNSDNQTPTNSSNVEVSLSLWNNITIALKTSFWRIIGFLVTAFLLYCLFTYSVKGSWLNELIHGNMLKEQKIKAVHSQVITIIKKWNTISSIEEVTPETSYIKMNITPVLEAYADLEIDENNKALKVAYLLHLAQLQIIETDVKRKPSVIFLAIDNLEKAQKIVSNAVALDPATIDYFKKQEMNVNLERSVINAHIFVYLVLGLEDSKKTFSAKLKVLGGCIYLKQIGVTHKSILHAAGCNVD